MAKRSKMAKHREATNLRYDKKDRVDMIHRGYATHARSLTFWKPMGFLMCSGESL